MTLIMLATISAELMCSERMHRKKFVTDIGCPETRGKRIAGLVEDAAYGRQRSLSRLQISAPLGHCLSFHAYLLRCRILNQERRQPGLVSVRNF